MTFAPQPLLLATEEETARLAARLAPRLHAGDVLLLEGAVGAGKSAFARALIRARLGAPNEDVPSPTFTLVQTYPHPKGDLWHADLYRLTHPDEAYELGLEEAFVSAISLIEWPDRLGDTLPEGALRLSLAAGDPAHELVLSGSAAWAERLAEVIADWPKLVSSAGAGCAP